MANLAGVNLKNSNLRNADLHQADLHGASLCETWFNSANLIDADLSDGNSLTNVRLVVGTRLMKPSFCGPNFATRRNGRRPDLTNADLSEARSESMADLRASLSGANLSGANLKGAKLKGANLQGAQS